MKNVITLLLVILSAGMGYSQSRMISGFVTDAETGDALIGASIISPETGAGTVTDFDGAFKMEIPEEAKTLLVSYTGYTTKELEIGNSTSLNILLQSGELLDEVVLIGYGAVKKEDKTGAIESIKLKDQDVLQYDNFQDYLQGRATGVQILSNGNQLLSPSSIRIRGANSLRGDNEPLFVVDGIIINSSTEDVADPFSGGNSYLAGQNGLTGINPQDIEKIEILKDASATAIYGSRGANGVILITTKKGKPGETKFNYKLTTRAGRVTNLYDVLDSGQYADYINEYRATQDFNPTFYKYGDGSIAEFENSAEYMEENSDTITRLEQVNWADEIYQTSFSQNHRLTASGGTDNSTYYMGAGYTDARGIVPGTRSRNGDFILKYENKLTERLTFKPRVSFNYGVNNASKGTENLGSSNSSIIRQIIENAPFRGYVDESIALDEDQAQEGPVAWINDYRDDGTEFRGLASINADYKINDIFTYRFLTGVDYRTKERKLWYGRTLFRGRLANGEAGISSLNRSRYNIDNTLQFRKRFNKSHRINGTVGFVLDKINLEQESVAASNFSDHSLVYNGISFGQTYLAPQYFRSEQSIVSFLGRMNYSLKNKYLFTFSFREDGSSKFRNDNRWSFFPSGAFAWKLIEEPFFKNNKVWSQAKLRIGYGRTGSQAINPYQTLTRFSSTTNLQSNANGGGVSAILPINLGNENLRWETTDQVNFGFDFGFLNDRFTGNFDLYHKKTSDLLQVLNIGPSAGFETIVTNEGALQNRGVELGLDFHILQKAVKWEVFGTFSLNRNKILDLGVPEAQYGTELRKAILGKNVAGGTVFKVPANIFIEGEQAGLFWGYETNGIIQNENELESAPSVQGVQSIVGDILYVDQNGDGNVNEQDLTVIGNPNPEFTVGLGSNLEYKGIALNFFINSVQGNDIANGNLGRQDIATGLSNNIRTEAYTGAWRPGSTDATHPLLGYNIRGDFTDRMVEDGSFTRLSFVSLSYNFPRNTIRGIDNLNVFVSGNNLLLFTKYSGFDPEVNSFAFDPTRVGIDWNSFPNQKSISFGLNLTF